MKNKKKIAIGAAALAVVMVSAGTFAWFSTTDKTSPNIFQMDNFDVTVTEDFDTPDVPLNPGTDVTKEVGVTNAGNVDVLVRVKLEEALSLLEQDTAGGVDKLKVEYLTDEADTAGAQYVPVSISDEMIQAYDDAGYDLYSTNTPSDVTVYRKVTTNGDNTVYSYLAYVTDTNQLVQVTPQGDDAANPTGFDVKYAYNVKKVSEEGRYSVSGTYGVTTDGTKFDNYYAGSFHNDGVILHFDVNVSLDGTVEAGDTWVLMDDGYFYYTKALAGESISDPLLSYVSINKDAGNALKGATYTITPVMEAVQVDWEAAKATWTELKDSTVGNIATVSPNSAEQLVYNIVYNGGAGYYSAS